METKHWQHSQIFALKTEQANNQKAKQNKGTQISAVWFPLNERNTATAIGMTANAIGSALISIIAPVIVKSANDYKYLLYFQTIVSFILLILSLLYLPPFPSYFYHSIHISSHSPVIINNNNSNDDNIQHFTNSLDAALLKQNQNQTYSFVCVCGCVCAF